MNLVKLVQKSEINDRNQKENFKILSNLEEGIVMLNQNKIKFTNKVFVDLLKNINAIDKQAQTVSDDVLDLKLFTVLHDDDVSKSEEILKS